MTTHNITNAPRPPLKQRVKEAAEKHKTNLLLGGLGALALVSSYEHGKTKGAQTIQVDLFVIADEDEPDPRHVESVPPIKVKKNKKKR